MDPFVGGNRTTEKLIKVFKKLPRFSNKPRLLLRLAFIQQETEAALCEEGMN